jgi:glucan endo-1,6-beta-glucosidase
MENLACDDDSLSDQKNFVLTVRAVEFALGIPFQGRSLKDQGFAATNFTGALAGIAGSSLFFNSEVRSAVAEAIPIVFDVVRELGISSILGTPPSQTRSPLITK